MSQLASFLSGATAAGFVLAGVFFLRFWRRTQDRLFAAFSAAFLLLAANQTMITLGGVPSEYQTWVYLPKLAAFALLILAIVSKNLGQRPFDRK
jgi:peptidoglycan/LPS O-acetylase OafA/YrhL